MPTAEDYMFIDKRGHFQKGMALADTLMIYKRTKLIARDLVPENFAFVNHESVFEALQYNITLNGTCALARLSPYVLKE